MIDAALVSAEITELHVFLEKWFNGALPKFRGLSIQIKNIQVSCESGSVGVATYEERHVDPKQSSSIMRLPSRKSAGTELQLPQAASPHRLRSGFPRR
jgi:hypothetical protein